MIFVISMIVELATLSLVSVWFSIGAIVAILFNYLKFDIVIQIIGFLAGSFLTFLIFRPILRKQIEGKKVRTNYDRLIGKKGQVIKSIGAENFGQVRVENQLWSAVEKNNLTLKEGELVKVLDISGVKLIVEEYKEEV